MEGKWVAWAGWPLSLSAAVDRIWTGLYKERNGIEGSPHKTFSYFVCFVFISFSIFEEESSLLNKRERET